MGNDLWIISLKTKEKSDSLEKLPETLENDSNNTEKTIIKKTL